MSHKLTAQIVRYCDILLFSLLRGSGLKSSADLLSQATTKFSLLRGSGLKLTPFWHPLTDFCVLPLTREWIEMATISDASVSAEFSLLRGSGLKSNYKGHMMTDCECSPSYEGVDWNNYTPFSAKCQRVLPLTREWIEILVPKRRKLRDLFSLLRGSGLKCPLSDRFLLSLDVLPLTREWIEMLKLRCAFPLVDVLPLTREWIEI